MKYHLVENVAFGLHSYIQARLHNSKLAFENRLQVGEFIAIVPRRDQQVDLNGQPYPFRVCGTSTFLLPAVVSSNIDTYSFSM